MSAQHQAAVDLLLMGIRGQRGQEQQRILDSNAGNPHFAKCLIDIMAEERPPLPIPGDIQWVHVRFMAGIQIKNMVKRHSASLGEDILHQAGVTAIGWLTNSDNRIALTAAQIISQVTRTGGLEAWRSVNMPIRVAMIAKQPCRAAFVAIRYLFEDAHRVIGESVVSLINTCVEGARNQVIEALEAITSAYEVGSETDWNVAFEEYTPFQNALYAAAMPVVQLVNTMITQSLPSSVKAFLLRLMAYLLDYKDGLQLPQNLPGLWLSYATENICNDQECFADAAHVLITVASYRRMNEEEVTEQTIYWVQMMHDSPCVTRVLPTLFKAMMYTEEEVDEILENDSAEVRDVHVRPMFGRKKGRGGEEDHGGDDESLSVGLIRSTALALLEGCAVVAPEITYPGIRSLMETRIRDTNWNVQESALMAMGVCFSSCFAQLSPQDVTTFLNTLVETIRNRSEAVLVRCTACYVIGKAYPIIFMQPELEGWVSTTFEVLVGACLGDSKQLQWAAVSALQVGVETACKWDAELITPYTLNIMTAMTGMAERFQTNNLLLLLRLYSVMSVYWPANNPSFTPSHTAFLTVLFKRIEDASRNHLINSPRSVAVREMLFIFGAIANLLQSGLQLGDGQRVELANACRTCIMFYYQSSSDEDSDYVTYSLHLLAVLFEQNPGFVSVFGYDDHRTILNKTVFHGNNLDDEDTAIPMEGMFYLSVLAKGSAVTRNQAFIDDFMGVFGPKLVGLLDFSSIAEDGIWYMGECCIHLIGLIPDNHVAGFAVSVLHRVIGDRPIDIADATQLDINCAQTAFRISRAAPATIQTVAQTWPLHVVILCVAQLIRRATNDDTKAEAVQGLFQYFNEVSSRSAPQPDVLPELCYQLSLLAFSFNDSLARYPDLASFMISTLQKFGPAFNQSLRRFGKLEGSFRRMFGL